jgi:hypothetical protein
VAHFYERLGPVLRDIPENPAFDPALGGISPKRGCFTGVGAALVAGHKNPVIASIGRSGTAIAAWAPGQSAQILFDQYADELVADLGANDWHIVTLHGESDAGSTTTANAYQAAFTAWVAHMRTKFPNARIYAVQVNTNLTATATATVRAAISAFVTGDTNAELVIGDSYGYGSPHYTDAGLDSLGVDIGARILNNVHALVTPVVMPRFGGFPLASDTNPSLIDTSLSPTFETDWTSREPVLGFAQYGTAIDAQGIADSEAATAVANGIAAFSYLLIYPPEIYHGTPDTNAILEAMSIPFQKYLASTAGTGLKFVPFLQSISMRAPYPGFPAGLPLNDTDGGAYLVQWANYLRPLIDDPRCLRLPINGFDGPTAPVVGMYLSRYMPDAMWAAFLAVLNRTFVLVDWNRDAVNGARLGAVVMAEYPPNPGFPSGGGQQHAYAEQAAIDVGYNAPIGFLTTSLISTIQDPRPRNTAHLFVDQPTLPEYYAHVFAQMRAVASAVRSVLIIVHAWDESAEDGPAGQPTKQEGTRYLAPILWSQHPYLRPNTWSYQLNARSTALVSTGTWTPSFQFASVSHNNEVVTSSTVGDTRALTHAAWSSWAIYGSTAPGLGTFTVQVDGVTVATVNQAAGSTTRHVVLASGTFAEGTHTVQATVASGTVELNSFGVTCNPQKF